MFVIFNDFGEKEEKYFEKLKKKYFDIRAIVMKDISFLPRYVDSIYDLYLDNNCLTKKEKNIPYQMVELPEYWEVSTSTCGGFVTNMKDGKAFIVCRIPISDGYVDHINWYENKDRIFRMDYYNKYGSIYKKKMFFDYSEHFQLCYINSKCEEKIIINSSNGTVTTLSNGCVDSIYKSEQEFMDCMLEWLKKKYECIECEE